MRDEQVGSTASVPLSTGHTVDLPLETEASMYGAVFAAPRAAIDNLLPQGIRPIHATLRGEAAVTLLSVEYHRVGVKGIEPYNEFSVIFPAVHESTRTLPYLSPLRRATSGYIWELPVTTEPARALGVEVWGYPKRLAEITHEDVGRTRRTAVVLNGEQFLTLEVDHSPSVHMPLSAYSYTAKNGAVQYVPIEVEADVGIWPLSKRVSVTLGDHPRAKPLRNLDLSSRTIARLSLRGTARFGHAVRLASN